MILKAGLHCQRFSSIDRRKEKRERGRQKKMWKDNIKMWTGMDFASSTRAAGNRTRWKDCYEV